MSADVMLSKEVQDLIGLEKVRQYEVTSRDIRRFAQAIGVSELATDSEGKLVAPPLFCQVYMFEDVPVDELPADGSPKELDVPLPAKRAVGGGSDFEILGTVRAGDVVTVRSKLQAVNTKQGKSGTLYLVVVESNFHNQRGEHVARETATYVKRI
jgi:hydroxyacyl-ACP dehydratase HTD2-like protein with hotdog domain